MATYLLKWNPTRWDWEEIQSDIAKIRRRGYADFNWTCANTKKIKVGDRAFVSRTSVPPCGIVGSGFVTKKPFLCRHWDESRPNDKLLRVAVRIDCLLDPSREKILPIERLDQPDLVDGPWHNQGSGKTIPPKIALKLERAWKACLKERNQPLMFDRTSSDSVARVFNRLFPDPKVRRQCAIIMADSMAGAHDEAPNNWGVTLFNQAVRLNVGRIEALAFFPSKIHCVLDSQHIPKALRQRRDVELRFQTKGIYHSVPVSAVCDFPYKLATKLFPLIRESHNSLIHAANKGPLNPAARKAYSPGVTEFLASLVDRLLPHPTYYPQTEKPSASELFEGATRQVELSVYERNPLARAQCIGHYGCRCVICNFDFEATFGEIGRGFIHVHHLNPISKIGKEYVIDPVRDLHPVCPNCHAMIHIGKRALSIKALKALLRKYARHP